MSTKYTLYIPNDAYSVEAKAVVHELTSLFRGHTQTQSEGAWYSDQGTLVTERTRVFTFLSAAPWHDIQYKVRGLERKLSNVTGEDVILSHHESTDMTFTLPLSWVTLPLGEG